MTIALYFLAVLSIIMGSSAYTIEMPRGFTPENVIGVGSGNFLLSDVATGNVVLFNLKTRQFYTVVQAPKDRLIQGLAYDSKRDFIVTAGSGRRYAFVQNNGLSGTANVANVNYPSLDTAINIYKKETGKPVAQCNATGAILIKDVTIDTAGNFAYLTDAFRAVIYKLDLHQLPNCVVSTIEVRYFDEFANGGTWYTGIGAYRNGVILNSFSAQLSAFVNTKTGKTSVLAKGDGYNDGLKVRGNCLFAVDALNAKINVYQLYKNKSTLFRPSAVLTRTLQDTTLDQPTALAFSGRNIVVPNVNAAALGRTGSMLLTVLQVPKSRRGFC